VSEALTRDWRHHAACLDEDPEIFFGSGKGEASAIQIQEAKRVCARCPVAQECLQDALDHNDAFGVWGGHTELERSRIKKRGMRAVANRPPGTRVFVDAEPVRRAVLAATATGLSLREIDRRTGVDARVLGDIARGEQTRITPATRDAIQAEFTPEGATA
jgi:WhiB family redox-sensing transcriptional regulator